MDNRDKRGKRALASRTRALCGAISAIGLVLGSCQANPGPPPIEEDKPTPTVSSTAQEPTPAADADDKDDVRTRITVGIDPLSGGFNPHLIADDTAFVSALADLVLPSPFHDGQMDEDLLSSAEEITPTSSQVVQTVQYKIRQDAQWSDGTPISAQDFRYLWQSLTTTPGVKNAAAYAAIVDVRGSGDGKTVDVDFSRRIAHWQELFSDLLPSHLLYEGGFSTALRDTIPAAGGRFRVGSIDRSRDIVEINRNDRYWGENSAQTEIIVFRAVRSFADGTDQLRSGQVSYIDVTPAQADSEAYGLLDNVKLKQVRTSRTLRLNTSESLPEEQRQALLSLIDVPLISRIATGRSANLSPIETELPEVSEGAVEELKQRKKPLRIAADPSDTTASNGARAVVDSLNQQGVGAELDLKQLSKIIGTGLPRGEDDAVLSWDSAGENSQLLAGRLDCEATGSETAISTPPEVPSETTQATGSAAENTPKTSESTEEPGFGNISGYCGENSMQLSEQLLGGVLTEKQAKEYVEQLEAMHGLALSLFGETRLRVVSEELPKPGELDESVEWPAGIDTAAWWRKP